MKVKLSWFSFFPAIALVLGIKIFELVGNTELFGIIPVPFLYVMIAILLLIANLIFSALDKKTSRVHLLKNNFPAGAFALLTAACIASKSFLSIIQMLQHGGLEVLDVSICAVGVFASLSLVLVSLAHIQGRNYMPRLGLCFLSIPAWLCLLLTDTFMSSRTISASEVDPVMNFMILFAMMLFLNLPMVISIIDGKNAVKNCFTYGFPVVVLGVANSISTIQRIITTGLDYSEDILSFGFFFMSVYIILFILELTKTIKSVDEQEIVFDAKEDFDVIDEYYGHTNENVVVSQLDYELDDLYGYSYDYGAVEEEIEDYVTEKTAEDDLDYGDLVIDDMLVTAEKEESDEDEDAILISKDAAEVFEQKILSAENSENDIEDEPEIENTVPDEVAESITVEESIDEPEDEESDKEGETSQENETIDKIDRLLAEIGSIDDI